MKKVTFILLLCLISAKIFSQIDTLYYDDDWKGVEHPIFAKYYRVLFISNNTNYANKFKDYWMTGELQSEGEFISIDKYDDSKSILNGKMKMYYKNGNLKLEANLVNGLKEGVSIIYYENGNKQRELTWNQDALNGKQIDYYENGNKQREVTMEQDIADGNETEYYEDGKIKFSCNYEDGKKTGLYEEFYPNGKLGYNIPYYNDMANGIAKIYDENGNFVRSVTIVNDTANGKAIDIDLSNGNYMEYLMLRDSIVNGKVDLFNSDGKLIISYNIKDDWKQIGAIIPTIADLKIIKNKEKSDVKTKDDRDIALYEINGLKIGAVVACNFYTLISSEYKSYLIQIFFENLGLLPVNCYFSDVKIEFVKESKKKSKSIPVMAYNPQIIYDRYAQRLKRDLNLAYSNARTTAINAATVSSSGSSKGYSSSSTYGNTFGSRGTVAGAVNNYGGAAVGASYSRGSVFGYASQYGSQSSNYSERTVDGLLRYQIEKEEMGKVDEMKKQHENQLNEYADGLYYNFTLNPEEPQWRSLYTNFIKADTLRVTLTINNIPYVFEWSVSHIKKN